jgi:hypothetical protein
MFIFDPLAACTQSYCAHSDPPSQTASPIFPSDEDFTGRQPDSESKGCYLIKVRDYD